MVFKNIMLCIFLFLLYACNADKSIQNLDVFRDIEELHTDNDKRTYLENILKEDQLVRNSEKDAAIVMEYGKDSKEWMEYIKKQWRQDELNLKKIELYLSKFGYPSKTKLGNTASDAPWIVIHHATDIAVRNRHFKILYTAYLNNDIDDTQLSFYLGRTFRFVNREDFYIKSPFKPEDEINGLIEALDLHEEKLRVLQNL